MNERIRELEKQAWVYQTQIYKDQNGYRTIGEQQKVFDKEKFAELIVRECGNVAWKCGSEFINNEIKRHFGVKEGHAFYCVACAKKLFGGYKESESFDRTASHMANEYVEYKEPILTDAEISESYYEVFKTAMIDIKAFEFAYSLLRKAQEK